MATRRRFIASAAGAGAVTAVQLFPTSAYANPLIWAAVRKLVWPAVRSLGGAVVRGASSYARTWLAQKAVDVALDGAVRNLRPESKAYKIALTAKRVNKFYGLASGVIDVAEAVKMILEADGDGGEAFVIWGSQEPGAEGAATSKPEFAMAALQLKLLHEIQPFLLRDLKELRALSPERAVDEEVFLQAMLIPQSNISHEKFAARATQDEADLLTFESTAADVTMLIREKFLGDRELRFVYDLKLETKADGGRDSQIIWATPSGGAPFKIVA